MLDFMIIGLPRSGTTWASNLFLSDSVTCYHDPLYQTHYSEWDKKLQRGTSSKVGISCTGIWRWPDWVNEHSSRKVVLHRGQNEIHKSMKDIGLPPIDLDEAEASLNSIIALHVPFSDLFDPKHCCTIWDYLLDFSIPFNYKRHELLTDIEMQPKFSGLSIGKDVTRRLMIELSSIGEEE